MLCVTVRVVRFLSRLDLIHVESSLRKYKSELNEHQHTYRKERGLAGHALGECAPSWFGPNFKIYLLLHISFMSHILPHLYDPKNQVDYSLIIRVFEYILIWPLRRSLSNKDSPFVFCFTLFGCFMVVYVILLGGGYMTGLWLQGHKQKRKAE